MSQLSPILRDVEGGGLSFWCPGCACVHTIYTGVGPGPRWGYNGDPNKPTFTPSVMTWWDVTAGTPDEEREHWRKQEADSTYVVPMRTHRCHSFVTDGVINFLDDCTHALRGNHPLPEWPKPKGID